ncbi:MauE/DoxX family redox-associated membrane protein [Kineococcus sp. SYSU DK003]|uniref:MauE/DoxX family redox-associated membrane protein n=1 Tax=Kineococcus sp. SYSU DK003 TaxID=3383124 RepID=UPI003D7D3E73
MQLSFLVGAVALLVAGVGKLRHPAGTVQALRTQGLPSAPGTVRALGATEVLLALAGAAGSAPAAWGVAALYAGFTGFVLLALGRRRPLSSCGCFGGPDLPPTRTHAVLTAALALAAGATATTTPGIPALLALGPVAAATAAALVALLCALTLLVLTGLPRLVAARRLIRPARSASTRPTTSRGNA